MQAASQSGNATLTQISTPRWLTLRDLTNWLHAFRAYFPRKAHLAERAAVRLSGMASLDELNEALAGNAVPDDRAERDDPLYAKRRMVMFREDRLILVREFRILPDAADQFLTYCPVGCPHCFFDRKQDFYFDEARSYYRDDQEPSPQIEAIIENQRHMAIAQQIALVDSTARLGDFLHPQMVRDLFHFLRLEFTPDLDGHDGLCPALPATRIGWVDDSDLGSIECFSLPFTGYPNWSRDEVFVSVLAQLKDTRDLSLSPVLLLNNRPLQLARNGHFYTAYGWVLMESRVLPLMVNNRGLSLADILVELVTFNPRSSTCLVDEGNVALSVFWGLLRQNEALPLPEHPSFRAMPDNWMILSDA